VTSASAGAGGRFNPFSAAGERRPVVARDLLVASDIAQRLEADHVLDAAERPVAAAQLHFPQDRVRRHRAIGQHDLGRRRQPRRLVGPQGFGRVAAGAKLVREHPRVEDRLPCAVRAARHHRMRRVPEQRQAPEGPPLERVLVDHRVFVDRVRRTDQRRHVAPVEVPVGVGPNEVVDAAGARPVALVKA
jgi:hypothetical protein